MILEGAMIYYCVGTMVPGFNATDNNVTVTLQDPVDIDNNTTSSSDYAESEYTESYTLTFECSDMDGVAMLMLNNETTISRCDKQSESHFKWLAKYHTAMCRLKSGFRHKNHWNRIRSRCWRPVHSVNPIIALVVVLVLA